MTKDEAIRRRNATRAHRPGDVATAALAGSAAAGDEGATRTPPGKSAPPGKFLPGGKDGRPGRPPPGERTLPPESKGPPPGKPSPGKASPSEKSPPGKPGKPADAAPGKPGRPSAPGSKPSVSDQTPSKPTSGKPSARDASGKPSARDAAGPPAARDQTQPAARDQTQPAARDQTQSAETPGKTRPPPAAAQLQPAAAPASRLRRPRQSRAGGLVALSLSFGLAVVWAASRATRGQKASPAPKARELREKLLAPSSPLVPEDVSAYPEDVEHVMELFGDEPADAGHHWAHGEWTGTSSPPRARGSPEASESSWSQVSTPSDESFVVAV